MLGCATEAAGDLDPAYVGKVAQASRSLELPLKLIVVPPDIALVPQQLVQDVLNPENQNGQIGTESREAEIIAGSWFNVHQRPLHPLWKAEINQRGICTMSGDIPSILEAGLGPGDHLRAVSATPQFVVDPIALAEVLPSLPLHLLARLGLTEHLDRHEDVAQPLAQQEAAATGCLNRGPRGTQQRLGAAAVANDPKRFERKREQITRGNFVLGPMPGRSAARALLTYPFSGVVLLRALGPARRAPSLVPYLN
jgi:hypothetical protein